LPGRRLLRRRGFRKLLYFRVVGCLGEQGVRLTPDQKRAIFSVFGRNRSLQQGSWLRRLSAAHRTGPPTGGDELRQRIRRYLGEPEAEASSRLEFRRASTMQARGRKLAVEIDAGGTSWALAA
jgi:hypothetical protein